MALGWRLNRLLRNVFSFLYASNSLEQCSLMNKLWHQHGNIFHKTSVFINNAVKTSNHDCIRPVYLKPSLPMLQFTNLQILVTNQNLYIVVISPSMCILIMWMQIRCVELLLCLVSDTSQPQNWSCEIHWKSMKQIWSTMAGSNVGTHTCAAHVTSLQNNEGPCL